MVLAALVLANFSNGHEQLVLLLAVPLTVADQVYGRPTRLNLMKRHQLKSELKIRNYVLQINLESKIPDFNGLFRLDSFEEMLD